MSIYVIDLYLLKPTSLAIINTLPFGNVNLYRGVCYLSHGSGTVKS